MSVRSNLLRGQSHSRWDELVSSPRACSLHELWYLYYLPLHRGFYICVTTGSSDFYDYVIASSAELYMISARLRWLTYSLFALSIYSGIFVSLIRLFSRGCSFDTYTTVRVLLLLLALRSTLPGGLAEWRSSFCPNVYIAIWYISGYIR